MEAEFQRLTFLDEWTVAKKSVIGAALRWPVPLRWLLPPMPRKQIEFVNLILAFRFVPTPEELKMVLTCGMSAWPALQLRQEEQPFTFAELLCGEFVPEVNPSQSELLLVEARVREASLSWTHFFQSMPSPQVCNGTAP
jgi:hypothetical protein